MNDSLNKVYIYAFRKSATDKAQMNYKKIRPSIFRTHGLFLQLLYVMNFSDQKEFTFIHIFVLFELFKLNYLIGSLLKVLRRFQQF